MLTYVNIAIYWGIYWGPHPKFDETNGKWSNQEWMVSHFQILSSVQETAKHDTGPEPVQELGEVKEQCLLVKSRLTSWVTLHPYFQSAKFTFLLVRLLESWCLMISVGYSPDTSLFAGSFRGFHSLRRCSSVASSSAQTGVEIQGGGCLWMSLVI